MKRRWIIRSFFIGLLLLCVGGWVLSYKYDWDIGYSDQNCWNVGSNWGKISLGWSNGHIRYEQENGSNMFFRS